MGTKKKLIIIFSCIGAAVVAAAAVSLVLLLGGKKPMTNNNYGGGNSTVQSSDFEFHLISDEEGYVLSNFSKTRYGAVVIPSTYKGKNVTKIGERAFEESHVTSVTIPSTITTICANAFDTCRSLKTVVFEEGSSLKTIEDGAFFFCPNLASIALREGVETIGSNAFGSCEKLTQITIPDSVTEIGAGAFSTSRLVDITLPSQIKTIANGLFSRCYKLESIAIPAGVQTIEAYAFTRCVSLKNVYYSGTVAQWCAIENNPTSELFADGTLLYANNLPVTSITESDLQGVTHIGMGAFYGYGALTSIQIPSSVSDLTLDEPTYLGGVWTDKVPGVGDRAFYGCKNLTTVRFNSNIQRLSIGEYAFFGCEKLTTVTLPTALVETTTTTMVGPVTIQSAGIKIGSCAFRGCSSLETITIPSSVGEIGDYAFVGCSALKSITIPSSVDTINWGVFGDCSSLSSVNLPEGVTHIYDHAFMNCTSLYSIVIPSSVFIIHDDAFKNCYHLVEIIDRSGRYAYGWATNLLSYSTSGSSKLTTADNGVIYFVDGTDYVAVGYVGSGNEIVLDNRCNKINHYAFFDCHNITSITLPNGLEDIGAFAFRDCYSLVEVINHTNLDYNWENVFEYAIKIVSGEAAESYISQVLTTTDGLQYLIDGSNIICVGYEGTGASVELDYRCTEINKYAFKDKAQIKRLILPEGVTKIGESAFDGCSFEFIKIPASVEEAQDALNGAAIQTIVIESEYFFSGFITGYIYNWTEVSLNYCVCYALKTIISESIFNEPIVEGNYTISEGTGEWANYYLFERV